MADYAELKRLAGTLAQPYLIGEIDAIRAHLERAQKEFLAVGPHQTLSLIAELEDYRRATRDCLEGRALSLIEENVRLKAQLRELQGVE